MQSGANPQPLLSSRLVPSNTGTLTRSCVVYVPGRHAAGWKSSAFEDCPWLADPACGAGCCVRCLRGSPGL